MKIAISGQAGSGKSTVASLLAKKLKYKHYSAGDLRREMALARKITLHELNKLGEKKAFTDKEVDAYQKNLGKKEDNFVIDGRLSFHFIPDSVKIFLKADLRTRAKRIFKDERKTEHYSSIRDAEKELKEREASDKKRYEKYYNIDCYNERLYDLVIDTTNITVNETVKKVLGYIKEKI